MPPTSPTRRPAARPYRIQFPTWPVYLAGLLPCAWLFWRGWNDDLGAEPFRELEQELGIWALRFLIGALAISPLRDLANVNLLLYRRAIGLLAFFYACLHLVAYLLLEQGLDWTLIWADIVKRPFITVGFLSFLIMVPLAVTSNAASIRRLGGQAWARLHRFVYVAAIAGAVHFIMLVKAWPPEPLIYAGLVILLLGHRLAKSLFGKKKPKRRVAVKA